MNDETTIIEHAVLERLDHVIDPELGRSVTQLGMIANVTVIPTSDAPFPAVTGSASPALTGDGLNDAARNDPGTAHDDSEDAARSDEYGTTDRAYDVVVDVELTVPGCPLSDQLAAQIEQAVASYPYARLTPRINVGTMSDEKLHALVSDLKAARRENPFNKPGTKTRIFAIASGKGGVGKSSISANLAATFAALGYDTAAIDADIYGFSLPRLFGVHSQPTNLNGMLMPVTSWGVKLMSIGMFAGSDRAILWRGPRLQRSLEQFLADVWWGEPDVLILDLAPGTGDMAISVAQALPNAELVVVTTPQPSASDIAVRSGLVALQVPMQVRGVVENMSYFEHAGERLEIFGAGGGERVSEQLSHALGHDVPLLARLPLDPRIREIGESEGRPAVLNEDGTLRDDDFGDTFVRLARTLIDAYPSSAADDPR
ncbi:P-loop NTPase [Bifidobacterium castoris]|uniref:Iron-sulfur cluster carrier protein n=1 Tax=Bifidobacterium castoris TaxID=2306972 RepID=A0A430F7N3_9BIFI|nr:P-loop NTPase [Bifidobacterium castoris]RSX48842.1 ATP-binding protein [Bifidobacterium castoris]